MAKVFATLVENGEVVLKTWSSAVVFEKTESWLDEKFIYAVTTSEFKGKHCYPPVPMFSDDLDFDIEPVKSNLPTLDVIYSPDQQRAYKLMFEARNKHLGIKPEVKEVTVQVDKNLIALIESAIEYAENSNSTNTHHVIELLGFDLEKAKNNELTKMNFNFPNGDIDGETSLDKDEDFLSCLEAIELELS